MEKHGEQRDRGVSNATPTDAMKRAQLDRILASAAFSNSQHLQHFLRYVTEQALAGHTDEITEYLIASRVFERGDDFDPGSDTVVRTQAYRLRTKLKEYYESAGAADSVLIEIPKGRYIPAFSHREPQPDHAGSRSPSLGADRSEPHHLTAEPPEEGKTPGARGIRRKAVVALAGAAAVLLAVAAGWGLHKRWASPGSSDPAAAFWSSFLEDDRAPIVAFSNGVYLASEFGDLFRYRGSVTGDRGALVLPEDVDRGLTNRALVGKNGPLRFDDGITGTGDLEAAAQITALLTRLGVTPTIKRSRLITVDDLRNHNVVFLGSPFDNLVLRDVARSERIVFDFTPEERRPMLWGNCIRDLDGEPMAAYTTETDPNSRVVKADHGVLSVLPSIAPNRRVMILAGLTTTGTQGAAEFACSASSVTELPARLAAGKALPRYFQCILRVEAAHGLDVLRVRMVKARPIRPE